MEHNYNKVEWFPKRGGEVVKLDNKQVFFYQIHQNIMIIDYNEKIYNIY